MAKDSKKSPRVQRTSSTSSTSASASASASTSLSPSDTSTHSIVTTHSNNQENETLMTSPLKTKQQSGSKPDSNLFEETLRSKTEELTELVLSISKAVNKEPIMDKAILDLNNGPSFDWEKVVKASELVFDDYSSEMREILKEMEELNKVY